MLLRVLLLVMLVPFFLYVTFCSSIVVAGSCEAGNFFWCFRKSTNDYDDDHDGTRIGRIQRIFTDKYGFGKTPEYIALIAEPVRGPNPSESVSSVVSVF